MKYKDQKTLPGNWRAQVFDALRKLFVLIGKEIQECEITKRQKRKKEQCKSNINKTARDKAERLHF